MLVENSESKFTSPFLFQVFRGNNDHRTVVKNYLRHNITALRIRFWPETYYIRPALRVELYGSKGE